MSLSVSAGIALTIAAFALGFCMARVSLCAVSTTQKLVVQRDASGITALALAAASAGLVLAAVHWLLPATAGEPFGPAVSAPVLLGGVLLAGGALLNGGCYVSSVSYVGTGNFHYLLTLVGLYLAARYLRPVAPLPAGAALPVAMPAAGLWCFAILLAACGWWARRALAPARLALRGHWSWPLAALGCGLMAACIALLVPHWSYTRPIEAFATGRGADLHWSLISSGAAIFIGAICSALLAGTFHWQRFSPLKALRCLSGGLLMGYAAAHIPGGNDTLLLWAIPALAAYGLVAYPLMLATLCVFWAMQRLVRARLRRAA